MTGILASLAGLSTTSGGGGGGGSVSLVDTSVSDFAFAPNFALAAYSLNSDGFRYTQKSSGGPILQGEWLTPQTGMSGYEARATYISGETSSSSPFGEWLNLGTTREWAIFLATDGIIDSNFTVEIRAVGTTTILASASVSLTAQLSSF